MNDELMHYGVVGMRWGVRRYVTKSGELTKRAKRSVKDSKKKQTKYALKILEKETDDLGKKSQRISKRMKRLSSRKQDAKIKTKLERLSTRKTDLDAEHDVLKLKIEQINSKVIKAGKDFIVDTETYKIPYVYVTVRPKLGAIELNKRFLIIK